MASELLKLDLYGILDVSPEATEKELVKAYRKRALKCHPDKNPDNPKAAELFHQLSEALEILTDTAARAAYDKGRKAKEAAEARHRELDSKRKKFKEDLENREKAAETKKETNFAAARNLAEEIERLRKEGSSLLQEEKERLKEELKEEKRHRHDEDTSENITGARLKIKWKAKKGDETNGGYNQEYLHKLFSKYGEVTALLVSSKKNGSAILEFASSHAAVLAVQTAIGIPSNPLTLSWLSGQPAEESTCASQASADQQRTTFPSFPSYQGPSEASQPMGDRDFESIVLMKMRQAEERKRLIAQMQEADDEEKT